MKKNKQRKQKTKNRKLRQRNTPTKKGTKSVPITPVVAKLLQKRHEEFIEKFGREPGPNDPIEFDPSKDTPQRISIEAALAAQAQLVNLLEALGVHPAPCHAGRVCDFLVTTRSIHFIDDSQVTDWENAIRDWEKKSGEEATEMYIPHEIAEAVVLDLESM